MTGGHIGSNCQTWLIFAFEQTAQVTVQFLWTDNFYDCFVCNESQEM